MHGRGGGGEIIVCKVFLLLFIPKVKWLLRHLPYFRWLLSSKFLRSVDTYLSERRHISADNNLNISHCYYLKLFAFSFVLESPYRLWPTLLCSAVYSDWLCLEFNPWDTTQTAYLYNGIPVCVSGRGAVPIKTVVYRHSSALIIILSLVCLWKCRSCLTVLNTVYKRNFHFGSFSISANNCKNFLL
jgi:hypothetical protein